MLQRENCEKRNIVLIGMPASGKSTVGVILAKILGMDFIDTDIVIQQRENARLNEIIERYGTNEFLKKEEQALLSLKVSNTVIATGGSAVYSEKGMDHLKREARVIYLKVELDNLKKRLRDIKQRGVVLKAGESFEKMFEIRSKLYKKYADIVIAEEDASIEDTVQAVIRKIEESE